MAVLIAWSFVTLVKENLVPPEYESIAGRSLSGAGIYSAERLQHQTVVRASHGGRGDVAVAPSPSTMVLLLMLLLLLLLWSLIRSRLCKSMGLRPRSSRMRSALSIAVVRGVVQLTPLDCSTIDGVLYSIPRWW